MRIMFSIVAACLVAVGSSMPSSSQQRYELCIRHFEGVALSDSEADHILLRANTFLTKIDGNDDTGCKDVELLREDSVTAYRSELPRSLATPGDFDRLTADACVKVVERIIWCGRPFLTGSALGCAPTPGQGMIVVRELGGFPEDFLRGVEPITWLHEHGHTLGLHHNSQLQEAVMAANIGPGNKNLSDGECAVFEGLSAALPALGPQVVSDAEVLIQPAGPSEPAVEVAQQSRAEFKVPVEDFVKQLYTTGIPVREAQKYSGDRERVEALLLDPRFSQYRANIIGLLGVIGTQETLPLLQQIVESPTTGQLTEADAAARLAAPIAMGAIASRFSLPESDVGILKEAGMPSFWQERLLPAPTVEGEEDPGEEGQAFSREDLEALSRDLAVQSTYGYALSGSEEAREHLEELREGAAEAAIPEGAANESAAVLDQALELNAASQDAGALSIFEEQ